MHPPEAVDHPGLPPSAEADADTDAEADAEPSFNIRDDVWCRKIYLTEYTQHCETIYTEACETIVATTYTTEYEPVCHAGKGYEINGRLQGPVPIKIFCINFTLR